MYLLIQANNMPELFHYTDEAGYRAITNRQNTLQTLVTVLSGRSPNDLLPGSGNAVHGPGVYFTDMSPRYQRTTLSGAFFGGGNSRTGLPKTEYFIHYQFHGKTTGVSQPISSKYPRVFLVPGDSIVRSNPTVIAHGKTDSYRSRYGG